MNRVLIYLAAAVFIGLAACKEEPKQYTRGVLYQSLTGEVQTDP